MSSDPRADVPLLAAWAEESRAAARPAAMQSARAAMHAAVSASLAEQRVPGRGFRFRSGWLGSLRWHPMRMTAVGLAAAVSVAVGAGWNAGAGSPLHPIQLVREDASLILASGSNAANLRLGYAEACLRDASAGVDPRDNLAEASSLLSAAMTDLPASHGDPLWLRWSHDESVLATLQNHLDSGTRPAEPSGDGGKTGDGSGSSGGPGSRDGSGTTTSPDGETGSGGDGSGADGATTPGGSIPGGTEATPGGGDSGTPSGTSTPDPGSHGGDGGEGSRPGGGGN